MNQSINTSKNESYFVNRIDVYRVFIGSVMNKCSIWTRTIYPSLLSNSVRLDSFIQFCHSNPINLPSCHKTIAYFAHSTIRPKYFIELFAAFQSRQHGKAVGEMYPKTTQTNPQIPIGLTDDPSQQVANFTVVCVTNVKADLCWISHICLGLRI